MRYKLNLIQAEWLPKEERDRLLVPLIIDVAPDAEKMEARYRNVVPDGFETNYANVRPFNPRGKLARAAVGHDWDYFTGDKTKKQADLDFIRVCRADGVGWLRRAWLYRGVQIGGWVAWCKHRRKQRSEKKRYEQGGRGLVWMYENENLRRVKKELMARRTEIEMSFFEVKQKNWEVVRPTQTWTGGVLPYDRTKPEEEGGR